MKGNKTYSKRLRVTPSGKIVARRPGGNHYKAKESRSTQLARKRSKTVTLGRKNKARFLPGTSGK